MNSAIECGGWLDLPSPSVGGHAMAPAVTIDGPTSTAPRPATADGGLLGAGSPWAASSGGLYVAPLGNEPRRSPIAGASLHIDFGQGTGLTSNGDPSNGPPRLVSSQPTTPFSVAGAPPPSYDAMWALAAPAAANSSSTSVADRDLSSMQLPAPNPMRPTPLVPSRSATLVYGSGMFGAPPHENVYGPVSPLGRSMSMATPRANGFNGFGGAVKGEPGVGGFGTGTPTALSVPSTPTGLSDPNHGRYVAVTGRYAKMTRWMYFFFTFGLFGLNCVGIFNGPGRSAPATEATATCRVAATARARRSRTTRSGRRCTRPSSADPSKSRAHAVTAPSASLRMA